MNPTIIKRGAMIIAGLSGGGDKTGELWSAFDKLREETPLAGKLSDDGYEVRVYSGEECTVHVGFAVSDASVDSAFETRALPESEYAAFDVYAANGYDSENDAMNEWLAANGIYAERRLGQAQYCVEYYGERFNSNEPDSVVEIWIPVERK